MTRQPFEEPVLPHWLWLVTSHDRPSTETFPFGASTSSGNLVRAHVQTPFGKRSHMNGTPQPSASHDRSSPSSIPAGMRFFFPPLATEPAPWASSLGFGLYFNAHLPGLGNDGTKYLTRIPPSFLGGQKDLHLSDASNFVIFSCRLRAISLCIRLPASRNCVLPSSNTGEPLVSR